VNLAFRNDREGVKSLLELWREKGLLQNREKVSIEKAWTKNEKNRFECQVEKEPRMVNFPKIHPTV